MRKVLAVAALLIGCVALGGPQLSAQNVMPLGDQSYVHRIGTEFFAPTYSTWRSAIISGNASTGSQSIVVLPPNPLRDGYNVPAASVFNTATPITVGAGAVQETVTPSAVSVGSCPVGTAGVSAAQQCATVTATFTYSHGASEPVVSGDAGMEEAITDAAASGGGSVYWTVDAGNTTLTATTQNLTTKVPSTFFIGGASAYVETTITTSTSWEVGVTGSLTSFCANSTTMTAGTVCKTATIATVGTGSTALESIVVTNSTTPGAGAIKVRAWGVTPVSSSF